MIFAAREILKKTICFFLLLFLLVHSNIPIVSPVVALAPTPTPTPAGITGGDWRFDPVVDEVGKNAARSRQLLYWVFSHSPRNRATVLSHMWSVSRNIVYVFFLLILAMGGIGFIVAKRQGRIGPIFSGISSPFFGFEVPSFIFKVAALLLFVTFSYVFVLGLMEFAQVLMDFFIKYLGGCNLFNINFGTPTKCVFPDQPEEYRKLMIEMEKNYTGFIGYRDFTPSNQEMANTSIFFVRLTTLTYNIMSIMVLLRHIILWFLLIVSPFLALFMPFIFIRNIGWIWIGVFLQWLFYGPLFALFIAGLVNIWQAGIPYGFDFSRTPPSPDACGGTPSGAPFPTSINILWGGPAQTLSQCNSANYIDTYAEYVIALIMLWATILLPWLLLRIFRDYCCDILRQNQATLRAIYNRLRTAPLAGPGPAAKPPKPGPVGEAAKALPLPFRGAQEKKTKAAEKTGQVLLEKLRDIGKVKTKELSRALDVSVESLRDIARVETDSARRLRVQERLDKIARPAQISDMQERQQFSRMRSELVNRAAHGDVVASRILASTSKSHLRAIMQQILAGTMTPVSAGLIKQAAQQTQIREEQVARVAGMLSSISALPRNRQIAEVSRQTELNREQAARVLNVLPQSLPKMVTKDQARQTARRAEVPEEAVSKVAGMLPTLSALPRAGQIEKITRETGLSESQAERVLTTLPQTRPQAIIRRVPRPLPAAVSANQIQQTARQAGVSAQAVSEVVRMLPTISRLTSEQQVAAVVEKTDLKEEQVEKVLLALSKTSPVKLKGETEPTETKVTVEDYEEVKTMWLNHYRKSAVPKSEKVRTRKDWLKQDVQKITNALNLLEAKQEEMKEEGLKEVEKILPFLLLGGFTDEETVLYMKAKLEAARQVMQELGEIEKVKAEAETEEEVVEVAAGEEKKKLKAERVGARELPTREIHQDQEPRRPAAQEEKTGAAKQVFQGVAGGIVERGTKELAEALDLKVQSISDVAKAETDIAKNSHIREILDRLRRPEKAASGEEKERYERLNKELSERAARGDKLARRILKAAARPPVKNLIRPVSVVGPIKLNSEQTRQVAKQTEVAEEKVAQAVGILPVVVALPKAKQIARVAEQTGLPVEKARQVLEAILPRRPQIVIQGQGLPQEVTDKDIESIARETGISGRAIAEVKPLLPTLPALPFSQQVAEVAQKTSLTEKQAERVLTSLEHISFEKLEEEEPKVTVEDYEEVKKMWENYYRENDIPEGENYKSRREWLDRDIRRTDNALNMLQAKDEKIREEALPAVERILPFLLLGGFSNAEAVVYLKAKIEAAKQVARELAKIEKVKAEAEAEKETVEVPAREEKEKVAKHGAARELPREDE